MREKEQQRETYARGLTLSPCALACSLVTSRLLPRAYSLPHATIANISSHAKTRRRILYCLKYANIGGRWVRR